MRLRRDLTLPAESFIDRFLRHVVPPRVPRIRHVGFVANCTKKNPSGPVPAPARRRAHARPAHAHD